MKEAKNKAFDWSKCLDKGIDEKDHYHSPRISSEFSDCGTCLSFDTYNVCVAPDELVLVRGNNRVDTKKIKDIKKGSKVLSYNHNKKCMEFKEVEQIFNREVKELYEIITETGRKILVTKEHPLFTNNKNYIEASKVKKGDEVLVFEKGDWKRPCPWMKGKSNPNFSEMVKWECIVCGKTQKSKPSKVGKVCSKECLGKFISNNRKGTIMSVEQKKKISNTLKNNKDFLDKIKNRDLTGDKNPNWKPKVIYKCPECGKEKLVTENQLKVLKKNNRYCSRKCGSIKTSNKLKGIPNPQTSIRMKNNNPMKREDVKLKQSKSLKKSYASGDLDWLKEKAIENLNNFKAKAKREGLELYTHKMRKRWIKYLKENNPMYNSDIRNRASKTLKDRYKKGEITPYWKGKKKPWYGEIINKKLASKHFISRGQQYLYDKLIQYKLAFVPEMRLKNFKIKGSKGYAIDAFLPELNIGIEYDGYYTHFTSKGKAKQLKRDLYIKDTFGIDIIRVTNLSEIDEKINWIARIRVEKNEV